jgi:hypothetical protein
MSAHKTIEQDTAQTKIYNEGLEISPLRMICIASTCFVWLTATSSSGVAGSVRFSR